MSFSRVFHQNSHLKGFENTRKTWTGPLNTTFEPCDLSGVTSVLFVFKEASIYRVKVKKPRCFFSHTEAAAVCRATWRDAEKLKRSLFNGFDFLYRWHTHVNVRRRISSDSMQVLEADMLDISFYLAISAQHHTYNNTSLTLVQCEEIQQRHVRLHDESRTTTNRNRDEKATIGYWVDW